MLHSLLADRRLHTLMSPDEGSMSTASQQLKPYSVARCLVSLQVAQTVPTEWQRALRVNGAATRPVCGL
jgi:hypothetical protein